MTAPPFGTLPRYILGRAECREGYRYLRIKLGPERARSAAGAAGVSGLYFHAVKSTPFGIAGAARACRAGSRPAPGLGG
jgi:hypothetical protein